MVFAHSNEINSRVYFKLYHQNGIMSVIYQWDYAVRLKISIYGVAYESNSISWYCHQKKPATSNMVDNIKSPKNQIFFFSPKVDPKSKLFFFAFAKMKCEFRTCDHHFATKHYNDPIPMARLWHENSVSGGVLKIG